jgi:cytochrome P450
MAKGEYIQMPSGPIHKDSSIWGPTASDFDPHRFLKSDTVTRKGESYTFLPWGSAPHLCPARQFASTEIMLFVALMLLRFEFRPPGGAENWRDLKPMAGELLTVMPPKGEVLIDVRRREGWQGEWKLVMGDSSKRIPLASG